jgi:hypothetical protein
VRITHTRTVRGGTEHYFEPTAPAALAADLQRLAQEVADREKGEAYGLLLSLYRADIPLLPAE